jgi:peptide/nickel transport system substrate-binding protein
MRKLYTYLSLLVVASFILAACAPTAAPATDTEAPTGDTAEPGDEGSTGGEFTSSDPTTFVQVTIGDVDTLDPALSYDTASNTVIFNVYDTLVGRDGESTTDYVPMLATDWSLSDDGLTYTFTIREGVTFHEGGELTASDVAFSFQRGLLQGGHASPQWLLAEPFFGIGLDDITCVLDDGDCATADDPEAVQATDPATLVAACEQVKSSIVADDATGTVTMTLAQAWGPFIATIAHGAGWGSIMDMEWVAENGGWDGSCDTWQNSYGIQSSDNPFTPIANGTGPFVLDHWTPGEEIVLVRNDNYWAGPANLETVVISIVNEFGTRFAMLQAGEADTAAVSRQDSPQVDPFAGEVCIWNADADQYDCEIVSDEPLRANIGRPGVQMDVLAFNFGLVSEGNPYMGSGLLDGNGIPDNFFNDVHVRRGFAYAFDYETYINEVYLSEAVQPPTLAMPGMPGYDDDAPIFTFDLEAAAAEFMLADLDGDGIPAGEDEEGDLWTLGFRMDVAYNQGNTARQILGELLADGLAQVNENFKVAVLGLPWPSYLASFRGLQLPAFTAGWLEDIHDPHNWYPTYTTGPYGYYSSLPAELSDQFADINNRGVAESDPDARHAIYQEANQLYHDEAVGIPIVNATGHAFYQRWVDGLVLNPLFPGLYFHTIIKH